MSPETFLPYGRHQVSEDDIAAVVAVLESDWLTTGPAVGQFEEAIAQATGSRYAVAVATGTAALHAAVFAAGISAGDEVIVPPLTFAASSNAVLYQGGVPVFADLEEGGLLLDPASVVARISPRTRAVIAVDYAGQPCDYEGLRKVCRDHGLVLIADACHSLGGSYQGAAVGTLADLTALSFHPVKPITCGEGGMVLTGNGDYAERMRSFRNHGISTDHRQRQQQGTWHYEMTELGYNYRLSDLQAALGCSQLRHLEGWIARRQALARRYQELFSRLPEVACLQQFADRQSGWHLFVIRVPQAHRDPLFAFLRSAGIGANVHYPLVYQHPYYRQKFPHLNGSCPVAERAGGEILSLPLFPALRDDDVERVVALVNDYFQKARSL